MPVGSAVIITVRFETLAAIAASADLAIRTSLNR